MKLTIVPQPKQMDFYGNMIDVSEFFNHEAQLFLQNRDKRLTYHAKRLCSALIEKENVYHGFHLVFGGGEEQIQKNSFEKCQQYIDAYRLDVNAQGILISAASPQGLFYGIITLERMREQYGCRLPAVSIFDYASVKVRCDYWDLRSIHPPFEKLLANIPVIAGCKLNAIVVEYEDKLRIGEPFCIENQTFSFSPQQFEQMKERCALWFLELIPLQQTFGHLEYVLKDPRFFSLRETPSAVGEMCPCKPQAAEVARALVQNMAKRHPESRYIHIGCDEVWSLGTCKQCAESGKSRVQLFIEFVNQVIEAAAEQGKTPLLWHDMFEHATGEELPTMRYFPLTVVLYRQEFFSSSDERGSLENKYLAVKNTLQQVEPEMKRVLAPFLSDDSIQQYMRSRFFVEELLLKQAEGYLSQKE